MSDIIKAITDNQLEDVGLKKKETEVISTKRKTTIKPTKKHQQGWLFKASPPKEYPVTGRNGGSNNPKSWQKDDVLRKLDELRSAFQEDGKGNATVESKQFDTLVYLLYTDFINGMEQSGLIVKPSIAQKFKDELSLFLMQCYFKGDQGFLNIIQKGESNE